MTKRVLVVGGGVSGCAAALQVARAGHEVVLLERGANLGGLVVSFSIGGTPLECFYHHIFPNEHDIIRLIEELGLADRLGWFPSSVSVLTNGRFWPFTSTPDLLRFRPLPVVDRIRLGLASLELTVRPGPARSSQQPAREWLRKRAGRRSMDAIWDPLLRFKFGNAADGVPIAWIASRFRQRASARSWRGERLGYLRGGFRQLFDGVHRALEGLRAEVRVNTPVDRVVVQDHSVRGVEVRGEIVEADAVIYAGQLPFLSSLVRAEDADPRWSSIGRLGAVCVVLEMSKPISSFYWTNCCDSSVPFGALIEHTNLLSTTEYGGHHIAYLGRYFTSDDPVATVDLGELSRAWLSALESYLPSFSTNDVTDVHPFRTPYASPLITLGYPDQIPPIASHITGLFVATTAQIYPQDRGMNEGIRLAHRVTSTFAEETTVG